ncbi:MAG: hypothetical protein PHT60_07750 [Acidiphilium sp.]|nr:hypothetical protein [Acidiphilium sp.]MDD4935655.1 hypothetical protein [Acidiphilium sp.]
MNYSEVFAKPEMPRRSIKRAALLLVLSAVSGCATYNPITAFHRFEGGKPGQTPPPAPGLDAPSPNLASVPPKPPPLSPSLQRTIRRQLEVVNTNQNAIHAPWGGTGAATKPHKTLPPATPPLLIGFQPGRAIVPRPDRTELKALAARRGNAGIAAIGFAPDPTSAGLHLALLRATAIADQLTQAGVPASAIRIEALAAGRGGAAQMLYAPDTQ